jgi:hypothetical protein
MMSLKTFTNAYIECLLWAETDDDGTPLDRTYSAEDLAPEARENIDRDCAAFYAQAEPMYAGRYNEPGEWSDDERAGHDFWLTRNGHGAGFWDRAYTAAEDGEILADDLGDRLSDLAKTFGEVSPYVGDDGQLYL